MKRKRILQKLANCISYDIKEGIVRFIPLYALTGVFVLAFGWDARMHLAEGVPAPSVLDLAVYMFQGMDEYVYVKGGPPFVFRSPFSHFLSVSHFLPVIMPTGNGN